MERWAGSIRYYYCTYEGRVAGPYSGIVERWDVSGGGVFIEHLPALGICLVPVGTAHDHRCLLLSNLVGHHWHGGHWDEHANGQTQLSPNGGDGMAGCRDS